MMFIPYICCGDPNMHFTYQAIKALSSYSDIIELGIPFSDPIADGKTIQLAANRALKNHASVEKIFLMVERLRKEKVNTRFVFMTYYNIIYAYDRERFLKRMKEVNVQGVIIPDLPFGEDREFEKLAKKYKVSVIHLIAQNTDIERVKNILEDSGMFTYLVSSVGTTGARKSVNKESLEFVKKIRKISGNENKLCVGFGISDFEQAKQFEKLGADGIIVGSKLIEIYSKHIFDRTINVEKALTEIKKFAKGFNQNTVN